MHRNCHINIEPFPLNMIKYSVNEPIYWSLIPTNIIVSYDTTFIEVTAMYSGFLWIKYINFNTGAEAYYDSRIDRCEGDESIVTKIRECVGVIDCSKPTFVVLTNIIDQLVFYAN